MRCWFSGLVLERERAGLVRDRKTKYYQAVTQSRDNTTTTPCAYKNLDGGVAASTEEKSWRGSCTGPANSWHQRRERSPHLPSPVYGVYSPIRHSNYQELPHRALDSSVNNVINCIGGISNCSTEQLV